MKGDHGSPISTQAAGNARAARRVAVDAFVKVRGQGSREFVFRTRDLSEGGLFLYTKVGHSYPFKSGSTLDLELYDYDQYVTCEVVVVRVVEPGSAESDQYPTGFGVKITRMDPAQRQKLAAMIRRAQQAGASGLY